MESEKSAAKKRIDELRALLEYHSRLYYIEDSPQISDYEYDKLFYELVALEEKYPEFEPYLVPKCEKNGKEYGACNESKSRSCGRHPRLQEIFEGYYNYKK